ncbi:MAG: hypothetical protein IJR99_01530 [Kiritimatiellae bacterium]|nr:hypothetical protein [Kiritimatiellia bacterium]
MRKLLFCVVFVVTSNVCMALDQTQFITDVCVITNEILNGWNRHVRDTVYPRLDGFQQYRNLSDEDFTRELLFIASIKRLDGSENEQERIWKKYAWRQTMVYLHMRNIPLKESIDFYESILREGIGDEMYHAVYNYAGLVGYTPQYFEKIDAFLEDKERRKDPARNSLLFAVKCNFGNCLFWDPARPSNVVSNRIVEYMEKRVRKDSVDACYFLDTLCKAKPEFKESEEWFERVRAILADESLNEYQHKPYRDQLQEAEKRREALRASGQAEKRES